MREMVKSSIFTPHNKKYMPESYKELLAGNKEWAKKTAEIHPHFFEELSQGQSPKYLWIGCADSRVPASEVTGAMPGSIFVQRNIANVVVRSDVNLLSVMYYAIKVLKVKHIIVCGHYGCGGVLAAMGNQKFGIIDSWLVHIKDVYTKHRAELDAIADEKERADRFVELNVMEQVNNLSMISFLQEEWMQGEFPYIHGWVYSLHDGIIKNLGVTKNTVQHLDPIYRYNPNA